MKEPDFGDFTVAIIGLGLMGGSLAAALSTRKACKHVIGVSRRETSIETARDLRYIDEGTMDAEKAVAEADLVVLATPVITIIEQIRKYGPLMKPGSILTDLGSTKRVICETMSALPKEIGAIGGHPMCGKERPGLAMADPGLFLDKTYVMTSNARTSDRESAILEQLILTIGARPLHMEADRHDRIVAAISHLPYLLSATLVSAANTASGDDEMTWQLASSGFRDTSRIAASDVTMMMDILATNADYVGECLDQSSSVLASISGALKSNNLEALRQKLEAARDLRQELYR